MSHNCEICLPPPAPRHFSPCCFTRRFFSLSFCVRRPCQGFPSARRPISPFLSARGFLDPISSFCFVFEYSFPFFDISCNFVLPSCEGAFFLLPLFFSAHPSFLTPPGRARCGLFFFLTRSSFSYSPTFSKRCGVRAFLFLSPSRCVVFCAVDWSPEEI